MKRGYMVFGADPAWGVPVVARTTKEAKLMAWKEWHFEFDCDWIDVRVRWQRAAIVDDLPVGIVDDEVVALRCNLIDRIEEA